MGKLNYSDIEIQWRKKLDFDIATSEYFFQSDYLVEGSKLKKIEIKNFKSIAHQVIEVGDINLITGYNSSGKSTISQFLTLVLQWLSGLTSPSALKTIDINGPMSDLGTFDEIKKRKSKRNLEIKLEFQLEVGTEILNIEFVEVRGKDYQISRDDDKFSLLVKKFSKSIKINKNSFSKINQLNISGNVPAWTRHVGIHLNKLIETKFTDKFIKKIDKNFRYSQDEVDFILINYQYLTQSVSDATDIENRMLIGNSLSRFFLEEDDVDREYPDNILLDSLLLKKEIPVLHFDISFFSEEKTPPIDVLYLYQLFPNTQASLQPNTEISNGLENETYFSYPYTSENSVILNGKTLLYYRLLTELKLVLSGVNRSIPEFQILKLLVNKSYDEISDLNFSDIDKDQLIQFAADHFKIKNSFQNLNLLRDWDFTEEEYLYYFDRDEADNELTANAEEIRQKLSKLFSETFQDELFDWMDEYDYQRSKRETEYDDELDVINNKIRILQERRKKHDSPEGDNTLLKEIELELLDFKQKRKSIKNKIQKQVNSNIKKVRHRENKIEKDRIETENLFKVVKSIYSISNEAPLGFTRYFNFFNKGMRLPHSKILDLGFNVSEIVSDNQPYKDGIKYAEDSLSTTIHKEYFKEEISKSDFSNKIETFQKRIDGTEEKLIDSFGYNIFTPNQKKEFIYQSYKEAIENRHNIEEKSGKNYTMVYSRAEKIWYLAIEKKEYSKGSDRNTEELKRKRYFDDLLVLYEKLNDQSDRREYEERILRSTKGNDLHHLNKFFIGDLLFPEHRNAKYSEKNFAQWKEIEDLNFTFSPFLLETLENFKSLIKIVESEVERLWKIIQNSPDIIHAKNIPSDVKKEISTFEQEINESLRRVIKKTVVKVKHRNQNLIKIWCNFALFNAFINAENIEKYNNFVFSSSLKLIPNSRSFNLKFKEIARPTTSKQPNYEFKKTFEHNDFVIVNYKTKFNPIVFTGTNTEDIKILRLKRFDDFESNKSISANTPVGITGDFTHNKLKSNTSVNSSYNLAEIDFTNISSDNFINGNNIGIQQASSNWLSYIFNTPISTTIEQEAKNNVSIKINDDNLHNVGSGVSQVLPIITTILLSDNKTIFLEEIEQNLHASAQARLMDLIILQSIAVNSTFIIETHSDHLINRFRLRRAQLDKFLSSNKNFNGWNVYFAQINNTDAELETTFNNLVLNKDGMFVSKDIPQGFFDQPQIDLVNLLNYQSKID